MAWLDLRDQLQEERKPWDRRGISPLLPPLERAYASFCEADRCIDAYEEEHGPGTAPDEMWEDRRNSRLRWLAADKSTGSILTDITQQLQRKGASEL